MNAALTLLDDPDADFYKVATECYSESPRVVRSCLDDGTVRTDAPGPGSVALRPWPVRRPA